MSRRVLVGMWLAVSVLIWNVIFDLYVSRGVHEYLQAAAEAELGRGAIPSMYHLMEWTQRRGAWSASVWALVVFAAGCLTVFARKAR